VAFLIGLGDHRLVSLSPDAAKLLRRIAANIAKLPELLRK
jgi:hypothetical protein